MPGAQPDLRSRRAGNPGADDRPADSQCRADLAAGQSVDIAGPASGGAPEGDIDAVASSVAIDRDEGRASCERRSIEHDAGDAG